MSMADDGFRDPYGLPWKALTAFERMDRVIAMIVCPILIIVAIPFAFAYDGYVYLTDRRRDPSNHPESMVRLNISMESDLRRWMRLVENAVHDGDAYFDMADVAETRNDRSRTTLVYMSPGDFLRVAEHGQDQDKEAKITDLLDRGVKFRSIPMLTFVHDNRGHAKVVGHEGRHRARALQARNVTQMPVILQSQSNGDKGPGIRWGSYNVANMPTVLSGETSGRIAMPQSVIFPPR